MDTRIVDAPAGEQDWSTYVHQPGELPPEEAVGTALEALQDVKKELGAVVLARQDAITGALIALLTGEHMLMLGPPGTAKSMLMDEISRRVIDPASGRGLNTFRLLMDKFTTKEMILGGINVKQLKDNGQYVHLYEHGTLASADLAFLDEIYKSSTAILNTLLKVINERMADVGTGLEVPIPLISLFCASNEGPSDIDALLAFHDRLLLRYTVAYLESQDFSTMLRVKAGVQQHKMWRQHGQWWAAESGQDAPAPLHGLPHAHLTRPQLYLLQQAVQYVTIPDPYLDALVALRNSLQEKGIILSDRRWTQALPVLQAHALLSGRPEVEDEDLHVLRHLLWNKQDEIPEITKQIRRVSNPKTAKVSEMLETVSKTYDSYKVSVSKAGITEEERVRIIADASSSLKSALGEIERLRKELEGDHNGQAVKKASEAATTVRGWLMEVAAQFTKV